MTCHSRRVLCDIRGDNYSLIFHATVNEISSYNSKPDNKYSPSSKRVNEVDQAGVLTLPARRHCRQSFNVVLESR